MKCFTAANLALIMATRHSAAVDDPGRCHYEAQLRRNLSSAIAQLEQT